VELPANWLGCTQNRADMFFNEQLYCTIAGAIRRFGYS